MKKDLKKKIVDFLEEVASELVRKEVPCLGNHTMYSSPISDAICPLCGESEEGVGGYVKTYISSDKAQEAQTLLNELKEEYVLKYFLAKDAGCDVLQDNVKTSIVPAEGDEFYWEENLFVRVKSVSRVRTTDEVKYHVILLKTEPKN